MKKIYLFGVIASAALAMTSCSSDETTEIGGAQNNAIEFGTYLGRDAQVRGLVTDNDFISFGVLASYTGQADFGSSSTPNFMYNQAVTRASKTEAWGYTPVKYWPSTKGDKVSFFAYAPNAVTTGDKANGIVLSGNSASGAPTATITLQGADKMIDFVAGVQMNRNFDNQKAANADENKVSFTLQHEMTRVGLQAKLDEEVYNDVEESKKTFVVIKSVKIDNGGQFYKSGKYTFSTTTGTRGTWTVADADKATADWNLDAILAKVSITANGAQSGDYKTGVNGIKLINGTAVSLFKAENSKQHYLFLIPAGAEGLTSTAGNGATATISYDIVTEDSKLAAGYSVTSATKTVSLPAGTLKQGMAYTYTFVIKLNEVVLSATVADWGNAENTNVDVPYNANN